MGKSWQGFALGGGEPNPRSLCTGSLSSLPNLIPPLTGAGIFPLWGQESLHLYPRKSLEMPCSHHAHTSWCGVRMGWRVQSRKNKTQPFLTRAIKVSIARWVIGLYSSSKALNSHPLSSSLFPISTSTYCDIPSPNSLNMAARQMNCLRPASGKKQAQCKLCFNL